MLTQEFLNQAHQKEVIRVLHIDDEPDFLKLSKFYLEKRSEQDPDYQIPLEIISLSSPTEAIQIIIEQKIDVIVSDYQMPELDGLELLHQLRLQGNMIPFIIFTGRGREEVVIRALNLGVSHYIKKGVDIESQYEELMHVIRSVIKQKRIEKALRESEARYRTLFEENPVSIWEVDFSQVKMYIDKLREAGVEDFHKYFENQPEEILRCILLMEVIDVNKAALEMYNARSKRELIENVGKIFTEKSLFSLKEELIALAEGNTTFKSKTIYNKLTGEEMNINLELNILAGYEKTLSRTLVSLLDITSLIETQTALKESEERYKRLSEITLEGVLIVNFKGKIYDMNTSFTKITGYDMDDTRQQNLIETAIMPKYRDILLNNMMTGYTKPYEVEFKRKDEKIITLEIEGRTTLYKGKSVRVVSIRDITKRKITESQLKESETRYKSLFESLRENQHLLQTILDNTPVYVYAKDLEGRYLLANKLLANDLQRTPDEVKGRTDFNMVTKKDALQLRVNDQEVFSKGKPIVFEEKFRQHGATRTFLTTKAPLYDAQGQIYAICGVSTDITDRKNIERALQESQDKLRTFFDSSPDGIVVITLNGNIVDTNPEAVRLFGYSTKEDLIGTRALDLIAPEDRQRSIDSVRNTMESGITRNQEYTIIRQDGTRFLGEISGGLIRDSNGNATATIGIIRDITARKQSEKALIEN